MTSLLEPPAQGAATQSTAAGRLRARMAAARVSFTWLGVRKSLSAEQRAEAAGARFIFVDPGRCSAPAHPGSQQGALAMTQAQLERAVCRATGESLAEFRRRGFSLADPLDVAFDPEPQPPQVVDWDEVESARRVSPAPLVPRRQPQAA